MEKHVNDMSHYLIPCVELSSKIGSRVY